MLRALSIRNVVLIETLDAEFELGLTVLTGETGSGKSILLDALGLAVGVRADSDLVTLGEKICSVTAEFELEVRPQLAKYLQKIGIDPEGSIILKRILNDGGRSRAFVNGQPVTVTCLREVGEQLVEIHNQMALYGLLDPANHGSFIDSYGGLTDQLKTVEADFTTWKAAQTILETATVERDKANKDDDFIRYSLAELEAIDPQDDEEAQLSDERHLLMNIEKISSALNEALVELNDGEGVEVRISSALQILERCAKDAAGKFDEAIQALNRAFIEAKEAVTELQSSVDNVHSNPSSLEAVEERLFSLRALARKHEVDVADLPALKKRFHDALKTTDEWTDKLMKLQADVKRSRDIYIKSAGILTELRRKAAKEIDADIKTELEPLKLENALFETTFRQLSETEWSSSGQERMTFEVQTNPNTPKGPIHKIMSGGELARLMLALKVVLADTTSIPTIVFDEVDAGIGGAAAAAVGERLSRLSETCQVLLVTHSPQVAAKGDMHWRISKTSTGEKSHTLIDCLKPPERAEEVARMISGETITKEARLAAGQLLKNKSVGTN